MLLKVKNIVGERKLKNKSGPRSLPDVIKETWWKYAALGFVEAEANYCIVKAYQYTSVTSVQAKVQTMNFQRYASQINL